MESGRRGSVWIVRISGAIHRVSPRGGVRGVRGGGVGEGLRKAVERLSSGGGGDRSVPKFGSGEELLSQEGVSMEEGVSKYHGGC